MTEVGAQAARHRTACQPAIDQRPGSAHHSARPRAARWHLAFRSPTGACAIWHLAVREWTRCCAASVSHRKAPRSHADSRGRLHLDQSVGLIHLEPESECSRRFQAPPVFPPKGTEATHRGALRPFGGRARRVSPAGLHVHKGLYEGLYEGARAPPGGRTALPF